MIIVIVTVIGIGIGMVIVIVLVKLARVIVVIRRIVVIAAKIRFLRGFAVSGLRIQHPALGSLRVQGFEV